MCMMAFASQELTLDQAGLVFPLVREAVPGLELKAWLRFARRFCGPRRTGQTGIMVVRRRGRPMPCGLFLYRREQDLRHGPILLAEHFVAIDVLNPEPVMRALVAELDGLAQRLGCNAIRSMVLGQASLTARGLHAAGHHPEGATLYKALSAEGEPVTPVPGKTAD
jgi:hypothetical protein